MDCKECRPLFSAFIDEELTAEEVAEIEQHMKECPHCFKGLELERTLKTFVRESAHQSPVPPHLLPDILDRLPSGEGGTPFFEKFLKVFEIRPVPQLVAVGAVIALIFAILPQRNKPIALDEKFFTRASQWESAALSVSELPDGHQRKDLAFQTDSGVEVITVDMYPIGKDCPKVKSMGLSDGAIMVVGVSRICPRGCTLYFGRQGDRNIIFWEEGTCLKCICSDEPLPKLEKSVESYLMALAMD